MFLLVILGLRGRRNSKAAIPESPGTMAETSSSCMRLLFVPALTATLAILGGIVAAITGCQMPRRLRVSD